MPPRKYEWLQRIRLIELESIAINIAARRLQEDVRKDPTIISISDQLTPTDVASAADNAEATYTIRLFAEFEGGLRSFLSSRLGRAQRARTGHLLDRVASRCHVPNRALENAHAVRRYRNALVHEPDDPEEALDINQARRYLCRFFSYLPDEW